MNYKGGRKRTFIKPNVYISSALIYECQGDDTIYRAGKLSGASLEKFVR